MLSLWSKSWFLSFNESKCAFISFHSKHPVINHSYQLDTQVIKGCEHHEDLGVLMSSNISWSAHIRLISGRAYKILGLLRRTFSSANSPSTKKSLYISLVRSQLIYCSHILLKDINFLENVQRHGTKFILYDFISDYKTRLLTLQILPLTMLYELNDNILFLIKSIKEPSKVLDYISFSSNATRSSSLFTNLQEPMWSNTLISTDFQDYGTLFLQSI